MSWTPDPEKFLEENSTAKELAAPIECPVCGEEYEECFDTTRYRK